MHLGRLMKQRQDVKTWHRESRPRVLLAKKKHMLPKKNYKKLKKMRNKLQKLLINSEEIVAI